MKQNIAALVTLVLSLQLIGSQEEIAILNNTSADLTIQPNAMAIGRIYALGFDEKEQKFWDLIEYQPKEDKGINLQTVWAAHPNAHPKALKSSTLQGEALIDYLQKARAALTALGVPLASDFYAPSDFDTRLKNIDTHLKNIKAKRPKTTPRITYEELKNILKKYVPITLDKQKPVARKVVKPQEIIVFTASTTQPLLQQGAWLLNVNFDKDGQGTLVSTSPIQNELLKPFAANNWTIEQVGGQHKIEYWPTPPPLLQTA